MKVAESNLELVEFVILNSNYKFIDPKQEINIRENFSKYEVEMDFGKRDIKTEEEEHLFNVIIKVNVNQTNQPQPGYQMLVEGINVFRIKNTGEIDDRTLTNLKNISALSISINNLRNYITNMTTYGPFGKYILPAVDVNHLIKQKIENQKNKKKK